AGKDFQAVAAAVQANLAVVLLDSGCSHHLMGTRDAFVDLEPSGVVKHVRGFNGELQDVRGRGNVSLQGAAMKQVLIPNRSRRRHDGEGGSSGDRFGDEVDSGQVACTASARRRRHHHELGEARGHIGLDIKPSAGTKSPCVSYVVGKLAWHTLPDKGSDAEDTLAVVHIDLCGPFRVAAKDGSLSFLLLQDRKTRYVWVRPVAKKSDVLREFAQWLVVVERQAKKSVLMLRSDRGGEFLRKEFTAFVVDKGIVHDLTCPYTPQQNGMAEREMQTVVESVWPMLLHMGMQHHWWHLALRQAVWVCNCLERSSLPAGTTPYQLLTGKKPDLERREVGFGEWANLWPIGLGLGAPRPHRQPGGHHVGRGVLWDDAVEVWKSEHGLASGRTQVNPLTGTSTATLPLLVEVGELAAEDAEDVCPPSPSPAPPLVADLRRLTPASAFGDEGGSGASHVPPAKRIAGGRRDVTQVGVGPTGEQAAAKPTKEQSATGQSAGEPIAGEKSAGTPIVVQQDVEGSKAGDDGREPLGAEESTDSDVVEIQPGPRRTGQIRRPPDFFVPAAFTTLYNNDDDDLAYDDAKEDADLSELDLDMHADPEHRWDISTMMVMEALASWKGEAVKAAMDEEIRSLISMGTWELVERPCGVNIMKNRWVLTTKYRIDDTVELEKARLFVMGFTQVYGSDYDETYSPVSSYVTLRIFLSIADVLNLNLMQLDMKNAFLQSKLDWVLYMYQPDYFNDETGRVCKLLKSLYRLKHSPLLWYNALNDMQVGAGWKKSQVDEALYFKVGGDSVACWLRKISSVVKYLGLEIVHDRPARKLWLHQQGYADKLRRWFIDEEQTRRTPKMPVSLDAYTELTFDDEEAQER
ncbi:unnamed protein product, partial [Closterium sp. NIES-54]